MIFGCYIWDRSESGIQKVETKDAAKDCHRTAPWQSHLTPKGSDGKDKGSFERDSFPLSFLYAQQAALKTFHFSNRADSGCTGSGCLPPLTLRPFSQMAEGSAATKHLMTCDKCGQTAGPGWAPWRPLIGQGRLINNSMVTAGLLLSGSNEAPPALTPEAGLHRTDSSRRAGRNRGQAEALVP